MSRRSFVFRARDKELSLGCRTRLMGIVNVTPDSFSDGGHFEVPDIAVGHALQLAEDGADILDIGGESSRPGADPISEQQEIDRVVPVIERIRAETGLPISVDTWKSGVAQAAIRAGADIVNDISSLRFDAEIGAVVSREKAGLVLMHMRGTPATMQALPPSGDILGEVAEGLRDAVAQAFKLGVPHDRILLDPGIGFGKTAQDNLVLLNRLSFLDELELPILVGPSRKSFLGRILSRPVHERVMGTAGACAAAIWRGAHVLRVHDVGPVRQISDVVDAILAEQFEP
jgi:dihydropteroate synthase